MLGYGLGVSVKGAKLDYIVEKNRPFGLTVKENIVHVGHKSSSKYSRLVKNDGTCCSRKLISDRHV